MQPARVTGESAKENVAATGPAKFDQQRLQRLMKQLGMNTFFVLAIGIGFILVAKRWVSGKKPIESSDKTNIEIKSTLRLSPKSNLHLVQAVEQRLIVAVDQNGIKTVVPLTESFANTLDSISNIAGEMEMETESTPDETAGVSVTFSDSLLAIAKQATEPRRAVKASATAGRDPESEADVRRKMEAALSDQGLKDLLLQKIRPQG